MSSIGAARHIPDATPTTIEANVVLSNMLTPVRYWRIARSLESLQSLPQTAFTVPDSLRSHKRPPAIGDGLLLAAYDELTQTGLIRCLGLITDSASNGLFVDWRTTHAELWVDTGAGRGYWKNQSGFGFAPNKVAGYGLHQLFADHFEHLEVREALPANAKAVTSPNVGSASRRKGSSEIAPERLNPVQVIGDPTPAPRGGYVYVLKSAYGCKVGRTRNVPNRMRAFGVHLPIVYSIPLCAWFDDHIEAESRYHQLFNAKRINGEWFDLNEADVNLIRSRNFA